jgi:hypothetical protein
MCRSGDRQAVRAGVPTAGGGRASWELVCVAWTPTPTSRRAAPDCGGDGFEFETLINTRVILAGLAVTEVPSWEHPPIHGVSNLNATADGLRVLRTIAAERYYQRRRTASARRLNEARRPSLIAEISERLPRQVTGIAPKLAGRQRAHLREAWDSGLLDDNGVPSPCRSGFVMSPDTSPRRSGTASTT